MIFCGSNFGGSFGSSAVLVLLYGRREKKIGETTERIRAADQDSMESTDRRALFYGASMNPSWYVDGCARGNADWFSPRTAALPWYYWYGFRM